MKKIIYRTIIIFIMICAMYINKVYAAGSFSISASKTTINKGESVTISIKANNAYGEVVVTAKNGTVSPSTVFLQTGSDTKTVTVTSTSEADIEVVATPGSNGLGDIDENPITGSQKLTIKVNKTNTTTNDNQGNQNTNAGNNNSGTTNSGTTGNAATPATKSKEARLSNLGIKPNDFSGFSKNIDQDKWYTEVPNSVSKVNVYATALGKAELSITGNDKFLKSANDNINVNMQLKEGDNTVKVTVTAEAGNTKTYTLTIKRKTADETVENTNTTNTPSDASDNSNSTDASNTSKGEVGLSSLEIKGLNLKPSFKTETYQYTVDLDKDLTSLEISTIPVDDDTTVEIVGNENLKDGENIITILVNNKKTDKTATYQITVNKNVIEEIDENAEVSPNQAMSWLKPSTWGKEEIIKVILLIVLIILIAIAIVLKIKLLKEKKEAGNIDLPGADELDKALAEHQELSELEEKEKENENINFENTDESYNDNDIRKKGKGKHF